MLCVAQFNYSIKHFAGQKNILTDALSRRPDLVQEGKDNEDIIAIPADKFINFLTKEDLKEIKSKKDTISILE
jgi:hypothetical protein